MIRLTSAITAADVIGAIVAYLLLAGHSVPAHGAFNSPYGFAAELEIHYKKTVAPLY